MKHTQALVVLLICLTSCATYNVQKEFSRYAKSCTPYFENGKSPTATYGGTISDVYYIYRAGAVLFKNQPPEASLTVFVIAAVDLPFSMIFDTVLLPMSIPRDLIRIANC